MSKRIISILLVTVFATMLLLSSALADTPTYKYYSDVSSADSYYDAVNYLHEHDVFNGYENCK